MLQKFSILKMSPTTLTKFQIILSSITLLSMLTVTDGYSNDYNHPSNLQFVSHSYNQQATPRYSMPTNDLNSMSTPSSGWDFGKISNDLMDPYGGNFDLDVPKKGNQNSSPSHYGETYSDTFQNNIQNQEDSQYLNNFQNSNSNKNFQNYKNSFDFQRHQNSGSYQNSQSNQKYSQNVHNFKNSDNFQISHNYKAPSDLRSFENYDDYKNSKHLDNSLNGQNSNNYQNFQNQKNSDKFKNHQSSNSFQNQENSYNYKNSGRNQNFDNQVDSYVNSNYGLELAERFNDLLKISSATPQDSYPYDLPKTSTSSDSWSMSTDSYLPTDQNPNESLMNNENYHHFDDPYQTSNTPKPLSFNNRPQQQHRPKRPPTRLQKASLIPKWPKLFSKSKKKPKWNSKIPLNVNVPGRLNYASRNRPTWAQNRPFEPHWHSETHNRPIVTSFDSSPKNYNYIANPTILMDPHSFFSHGPPIGHSKTYEKKYERPSLLNYFKPINNHLHYHYHNHYGEVHIKQNDKLAINHYGDSQFKYPKNSKVGPLSTNFDPEVMLMDASKNDEVKVMIGDTLDAIPIASTESSVIPMKNKSQFNKKINSRNRGKNRRSKKLKFYKPFLSFNNIVRFTNKRRLKDSNLNRTAQSRL